MGVSHSKLTITPKDGSKEAAEATKEAVENGAAPAAEVAETEEQPAANGDVPAPEGDAVAETSAEGEVKPTPQKKKNPINWIQKKISFKKIKTPKKAAPAASSDEAEAPTAETEESDKAAAETQAETVPTAEQGTGQSDPVSADQPIVEVAPTENGVHSAGEEHYEKPEEKEEPAAPTEVAVGDVSAAEADISGKLASLGVAPAENGTNGSLVAESNGLNGDAAGHEEEQ